MIKPIELTKKYNQRAFKGSMPQGETRQELAEQGFFDALSSQKKPGEKIAKGKLVDNKDTFGNIAYDLKSSARDYKNIARAVVKGEADDYDLGRINDVGLKLGGLAIAATLATSKFTTPTKLMELIGVGTFFATMKLWPKLTIHKPLEKEFGFNIGQKYINSQGKKKDFFQDNQYLPWDLWSKEEINKIGDHMGVDKKMPDREEFIKRKMQKVALQGNTLNLMTAGFATPVMTALICRALEKPVEKAVVSAKLRNAEYQMENFEEVIGKLTKSKRFDLANKKEYEKLIKDHKHLNADQLDDSFIAKFARIINPTGQLGKAINPANTNYEMTDASPAVRSLLESLKSKPVELVDNERVAKEIKAAIAKDFPQTPKEIFDALDDVIKKSYDYTEMQTGIRQIYFNFNKKGLIPKSKAGAPSFLKALNVAIDNSKKRPAEEILRELTNDGRIFEDQKRGRAIIKVLEKYGYSLAGEASDSHYTLVNKKYIDDIFREMSPSLKELKGLSDPKKATEALQKTFMQVAENNGPKGRRGTLEYFVKKVVEDILAIDTPSDKFVEKIDKLTDMGDGVSKIVRDEVETYGRLTKGIIKHNKEMVEARGIRLILTADVEKRLKDHGATLSDEVKAAVRKIIYETSGGFKIDKEDHITRQAFDFIFKGETDEKILKELKRSGGDRVVELFKAYKAKFGKLVDGDCLTNIFGTDLNRLVKNSSQSLYKSKLWLRVFGIAGIAIVGTTLVAQKFFGKMKQEEKEFLAKKGGLDA